jgi:tRNA(fMet)-specific endonuclease VapC
MILLDTDHLSIVSDRRNSRHAILVARLEAGPAPFTVPIVSVEEQCRGWLAQIKRWSEVHDQIPAYENLAKLIKFLGAWQIALFDTPAANEFVRLRKQKIRIGSQDLKIAAIALVNDALLLSANLRDFRKVSGLRVESWLD